ncbi:MAG: hypothetical protein FJX76_02090 [Armatimonadetes bacterium]|nr:hypothetical protein [Armatimonadota bacterium]
MSTRVSLLTERSRGGTGARRVARAVVRAAVVLAMLLLAGEMVASKFVDEDVATGTAGFSEFRPDPLRFWALRPNLDKDVVADQDLVFHVRSNALGFRNDDIPVEKPANGYRVLCLGDSITYGYGVAQDQTYEAVLQRLLQRRAPGRDVQIINGGVPGYSSFQGLHLLRDGGLRYAPDVLVVGFIYADPATEASSDRERAGDATPLQPWLYQSRLYLYLRRASLASRMPTGPRDVHRERVPRVSLEDYEANMRAFAEIMRKRKGHVIYLNLARKPDMPGAEKWLDPHQERYDRYRAAVRKIADETGNAYLDLDEMFARDGRYFIDPIHPNATGFDYMARAISDTLHKRGWI